MVKSTVSLAQFLTTVEPCALIRHWLFSKIPVPASSIFVSPDASPSFENKNRMLPGAKYATEQAPARQERYSLGPRPPEYSSNSGVKPNTGHPMKPASTLRKHTNARISLKSRRPPEWNMRPVVLAVGPVVSAIRRPLPIPEAHSEGTILIIKCVCQVLSKYTRPHNTEQLPESRCLVLLNCPSANGYRRA